MIGFAAVVHQVLATVLQSDPPTLAISIDPAKEYHGSKIATRSGASEIAR